MSYDLRAVIADAEVLRNAARDLSGARLALIGRGLSLMPMTDVLFDSLTDGSGVSALGFRGLPGGFEKTLSAWSVGGPMAYVEAEYFGGAGEQRAAVWSADSIVLGPLHVGEGQPLPPAGSPISQALRRLGVVADLGEDEFSATGLDRHRHSEAWTA
ncbi:hypothetical protein ACFY8K_30620 [Streptomyces misionensis]|uniref:hypothetical protein n=1 Tax=Streptomyces misionensis TaxID=67331 RepID=UPI00368B0B47